MPNYTADANAHGQTDLQATQLTAGAVSTTAAGTISPTINAGQSPTVTVTDATDSRGSFILNPVTGGGAQAAGSVVQVRFLRPYTKAPVVTLTGAFNETDGNAAVGAYVTSVNELGFTVAVGGALTTAKAYRITYTVTP